MSAIAETAALSFAYGGSANCVLREVDLRLEQGELVLVAGPSGGGKSTLLRCLNGLIPHFHGGRFSGRVLVDGLDTRTHQPRELAAAVGLVFQDPEAQSVARTVQEEIVFGMENRGIDRRLIRKRLEEVLDALGIAGLRTREVATLSGGELQRVAIAAVLTMQPQLVLMDEPTSQLDPQAADDVLRMARDLREDHGLTVVVAEHRLDRVAAFIDRVLHMPGDGTVQSVTPREAMETLQGAPPVSRIGKALAWSPLPLSVAEARRFLLSGPAPSVPSPIAATSLRGESSTGELLASMRAVFVRFAARTVLSIDRLDFREGESVGLMGRNGAGKTTLLRVLAGLARPTIGTVDGLTRVDARARYKDIAFVPQDPAATLFKATLEAEIQDVLDGTGRRGTVDEALAEWDLDRFRHSDHRDLSVGERQRAALAAILAGRPRLILLDEPTRGMDAETRQLLLRNLRQRRADGACVVLASHDVELMASCAERVILLAEGEVILDGPVRSVLTGSTTFSTQANKLFGGDVLTPEDALGAAGGGMP